MWTKILGDPLKKFLKKIPSVWKNTVSILVKTFFFLEITLTWTEKLTQSEWRPIKTWVTIVWCCLQPPKQPPPPIANSWVRACSQFSSRAGSHWCWETLEGGHRPSKVGNHCCRPLIRSRLFVWGFTRKLTTETAWINCEYRLNIESNPQMTNKPYKKFLRNTKMWRIRQTGMLVKDKNFAGTDENVTN